MKSYVCLQQQHFEQASYSISSVQEAHIEQIRKWRNAQLDVLRQSIPIEPQQQIYYFNKKIWPSMLMAKPATILVSFFHNGKLIGYGGLVHIAWEHRRAEISFLLSPERGKNYDIYQTDFSTFLSLMKRMAFSDLKLHRIFTETFDIRTHHIKILESNGFVREGVLREHVWIDAKAVSSIFHGCLNKYE